MEPNRCPWCLGDPLYIRYHDEEWGVPLRDDKKLFGLLVLEGAQAGLSWLTILRRREGYMVAMDALDPERIARYTERDKERLAADPRIIRNKRKIQSAVENARAYLRMKDSAVSFSEWLWGFVDGKPIVNNWGSLREVPVATPLAERVSKELRGKGFSFVGPTIVYAFMQSSGLVNDHLVDCHRHAALSL